MPILFSCTKPGCGKSLRAKEELAGKRIKCPGCGQVVQIPDTSEENMQAPAPAKAKASVSAAVAQGDSPRKAKSSKSAPAPSAELTDLEKMWQKSPLLKRNEFQVCPRIWQGGFNKLGPTYDYCPPDSKEVLGESNYRHTWLTTILKLFKLHDFVPHWIEVADKHDTLFWIKVVKMVNNRYDLYDPSRKELFGSLKTVFSLKLWLRLLDPQGKDIGEVVSADLPALKDDNAYWGFGVNSTDGRNLGDVTNNAHHCWRYGIKGFSLNRGFVGTVAPEFTNDPRPKVLILATTIVTYLENMGAMHFDPMSVK